MPLCDQYLYINQSINQSINSYISARKTLMKRSFNLIFDIFPWWDVFKNIKTEHFKCIEMCTF